jgi:RNA polymerase sigma-70 factor (ECF subfamily)
VADAPQRLQRNLAEGDPAAYGRAYEQFAPPLYRAAARMLGSAADAEDAVQEVFVGLVRARERLYAVADLKAYLFAALRHAAWRLVQRRRRQAAVSLDEDSARVQQHCTEEGGADDRLARAVARLPIEQRQVLAMKIDGELTFQQIAAVLGINPNTAASRYRYALAKLRDLMGAGAAGRSGGRHEPRA